MLRNDTNKEHEQGTGRIGIDYSKVPELTKDYCATDNNTYMFKFMYVRQEKYFLFNLSRTGLLVYIVIYMLEKQLI